MYGCSAKENAGIAKIVVAIVAARRVLEQNVTILLQAARERRMA
jgi:hypothetical protein